MVTLYPAVNFFKLGPGSWCPFCLAQGLLPSRSLINVSCRNQKEKERMSENLVRGQIPPPPGQGLQSLQEDHRKQEAKRADHRALQRAWRRFLLAAASQNV